MEQLVMGSEGTLGIITKATLKLQPLPPYRFDLLAVFQDAVQALSVVPQVIKAGINPTSIEYMDNSYVRSTSEFLNSKVLRIWKTVFMLSLPLKPIMKTN